MCLLQVISSIFSFQSLPVFPLLFKRSPSFEFPTRLPSTSVWKNALSKQLAALWPFLQTLFQPSHPYILSSLQSCDAGFFCALCTHYLCAHSPLLIYAEVIFCHCGRFDHLTQLTPTASREKEKKQPLSSSEMGKKNKKKTSMVCHTLIGAQHDANNANTSRPHSQGQTNRRYYGNTQEMSCGRYN